LLVPRELGQGTVNIKATGGVEEVLVVDRSRLGGLGELFVCAPGEDSQRLAAGDRPDPRIGVRARAGAGGSPRAQDGLLRSVLG
jgi:hypothetical protein